eukprot:SAG11_NODE_2015_length_3921_cov_2.436944_4_plen_135_part_00
MRHRCRSRRRRRRAPLIVCTNFRTAVLDQNGQIEGEEELRTAVALWYLHGKRTPSWLHDLMCWMCKSRSVTHVWSRVCNTLTTVTKKAEEAAQRRKDQGSTLCCCRPRRDAGELEWSSLQGAMEAPMLTPSNNP